HRGTAVALQRAMDVGDGRDHDRDRAAGPAVHRFPATHRLLDRPLGCEVNRPRSSTLAAGALGMVAVLLAGIAMLLNYSGEPQGNKIVVRVRVWGPPIADAYRQSFAEFNRTHPDIEVRVNLVAYATYFNTLRTDVAGGSADDIFWLSNAYFARYADSGRLLDINKTLSAEEISDWEPAVVDQFTRDGKLWGVPQ